MLPLINAFGIICDDGNTGWIGWNNNISEANESLIKLTLMTTPELENCTYDKNYNPYTIEINGTNYTAEQLSFLINTLIQKVEDLETSKPAISESSCDFIVSTLNSTIRQKNERIKWLYITIAVLIVIILIIYYFSSVSVNLSTNTG